MGFQKKDTERYQMSTNNDCKDCKEPAFIPTVKEKKEPVGNDEFVEPKSCGNCIHQQACGPYWMMKKMVNEMHKEFGYMIRFPMPLTMLAGGCKEYLDKRTIIKPDKSKK